MAKTTKTGFVASTPIMSMGGTDMVKKSVNVFDPTDGIGMKSGGQRQATSPDSHEEPVDYILDQYRQLRSRLGFFRDTISTQELLNRAGLKLSLVERDWNTVFGLMRNGRIGGFIVRGQNDLLRNLNGAGLDLEQAAVQMGPRSITSLADQDLFSYLIRQVSIYRSGLRSIGINSTDSVWDHLLNSRVATTEYNNVNAVDTMERAAKADVNSWVKQTGFQAPSMTKGSKGLLGDCSMTGQVITGLVVGGAILALYKTCKK